MIKYSGSAAGSRLKTKGGLGRRIVFRIPTGDDAPLPPVHLGIQSGRFRYPPEGLFGGQKGALARFLVNGEPGNPYGLTRLKPGDVVTMDAAGCGGYGEARERDPELVREDVIDGYISIEDARDRYGVVIDNDATAASGGPPGGQTFEKV